MANGFHGSKAQWERLEMPLRALDSDLQTFSKRSGIPLSSGGKNGPDRSLAWGESIRRLIQIYVAEEEAPTYNFWVCAVEDRGGERYWRQEFLRKSVPIGDIAIDLPGLLERGRVLLESWTSETLQFATTLTPLR